MNVDMPLKQRNQNWKNSSTFSLLLPRVILSILILIKYIWAKMWSATQVAQIYLICEDKMEVYPTLLKYLRSCLIYLDPKIFKKILHYF